MVSIIKMRQHIARALWSAGFNSAHVDTKRVWDNELNINIKNIYLSLADQLIADMINDGALPSTTIVVRLSGGDADG